MPTNKPGCLATLFGAKPKSKTRAELVNPQVKSVILDNQPPKPAVLPYRLATEFFSPAEANFYRILKQIVGEHLLIFPKVGLKEFLFITEQEQFQSHFNRIDRKHVDFLLCNPNSLKPIFAIELDDSSHRQGSRAQRDAFIETVLAATNLPLVRIPVRASYNVQELSALFKNALQRQKIRADAQENAEKEKSDIGNPPYCPNCGTQMVLRTAQKGINVGEKFWGCPNYPKCKTIIKLV